LLSAVHMSGFDPKQTSGVFYGYTPQLDDGVLVQNYQPRVPATPDDFAPHVGDVAANGGSRGDRRRLALGRRTNNLLKARQRGSRGYIAIAT